jgi:DNA-binding MarR family transcriptional regulator
MDSVTVLQATEPADANELGPETDHAEPVKQSGTLPIARALYRLRRRRERLFTTSLFSEPAWDLLLDLFASEKAGKPVSITSACIAAAVPNTTAVRCLQQLEQRGVLFREPDPLDRRRTNIRLTNTCISAMESLFEELRLCLANDAPESSNVLRNSQTIPGNLLPNLDGYSSRDRLDRKDQNWSFEPANSAKKGNGMQELSLSPVSQFAYAAPLSISDLTNDEIDFCSGASTWGENVLKYGGVGGFVGSFVGPEGAAIGAIGGAVVGTAVTYFD